MVGPPQHHMDGPPQHHMDGPPQHRMDGPSQHLMDGPPQHLMDGPPQHLMDGPPQHRKDGLPLHSMNGPPERYMDGPSQHRMDDPLEYDMDGPPGHQIYGTLEYHMDGPPEHQMDDSLEYNMDGPEHYMDGQPRYHMNGPSRHYMDCSPLYNRNGPLYLGAEERNFSGDHSSHRIECSDMSNRHRMTYKPRMANPPRMDNPLFEASFGENTHSNRYNRPMRPIRQHGFRNGHHTPYFLPEPAARKRTTGSDPSRVEGGHLLHQDSSVTTFYKKLPVRDRLSFRSVSHGRHTSRSHDLTASADLGSSGSKLCNYSQSISVSSENPSFRFSLIPSTIKREHEEGIHSRSAAVDEKQRPDSAQRWLSHCKEEFDELWGESPLSLNGSSSFH
ncbi:hypothetical protein HAZT_HAZT003003 [Hyalella azteca]|uniref:Uncharacterized protein n=1 Tax=Hyalella azteca TaxID=294128 RepID=A0A6A0HDF6_HYAAZ|nr:hypothetical protein HAZT_HAZT003003 [Hyalella azteca]